MSPASGGNLNSAPYATVAFAGHVLAGGRYCDCNGQCMNNITIATSDESMSNQDVDAKNTDSASHLGHSSGTILLTLAIILFLGMRS